MGAFREQLEKSGANKRCKLTVDGESVTLDGINRSRDLAGVKALAVKSKDEWFRVSLPKDEIHERAVSKDSGEIQGKAIVAVVASLESTESKGKGKGKGKETASLPDAIADRTQTPEMSGNGVS